MQAKSEETGSYFIVDNVIIGDNHIINNSGCINILQRLDNSRKVLKVFCEQKHGRSLRAKVADVPNKTIEYNPVKVISPKGSVIGKVITWIRKLREDNHFLKNLFELAGKEKPELLFFCTIIPANLFLHIGRIRKNRDQKVIICLHGEIEHLFRPDVWRKDKVNAYFYKKAFSASPPNLKYLVLSPLIKSKIVESGYLTSEQLVSIEHPANELTPVPPSTNQQPVLALLGMASKRKNAGQIFTIAEQFRKQVENQYIKFQIIGQVSPELLPSVNQYVAIAAESGKPIEQAKFEQLIQQADYAMSFITGYEYLFRISGSVIDSVQYHLPVIAMRHDYITHMFQQAGDIGFICDSLEDMYSIVDKVIRKDDEVVNRYAIQVENLRNYAKRFYAPQNAGFLREQLHAAGWDFGNKN